MTSLPTRCYTCNTPIGNNNSVQLICECMLVICEDCAKHQLSTNSEVLSKCHIQCPGCRKQFPILHLHVKGLNEVDQDTQRILTEYCNDFGLKCESDSVSDRLCEIFLQLGYQEICKLIRKTNEKLVAELIIARLILYDKQVMIGRHDVDDESYWSMKSPSEELKITQNKNKIMNEERIDKPMEISDSYYWSEFTRKRFRDDHSSILSTNESTRLRYNRNGNEFLDQHTQVGHQRSQRKRFEVQRNFFDSDTIQLDSRYHYISKYTARPNKRYPKTLHDLPLGPLQKLQFKPQITLEKIISYELFHDKDVVISQQCSMCHQPLHTEKVKRLHTTTLSSPSTTHSTDASDSPIDIQFTTTTTDPPPSSSSFSPHDYDAATVQFGCDCHHHIIICQKCIRQYLPTICHSFRNESIPCPYCKQLTYQIIQNAPFVIQFEDQLLQSAWKHFRFDYPLLLHPKTIQEKRGLRNSLHQLYQKFVGMGQSSALWDLLNDVYDAESIDLVSLDDGTARMIDELVKLEQVRQRQLEGNWYFHDESSEELLPNGPLESLIFVRNPFLEVYLNYLNDRLDGEEMATTDRLFGMSNNPTYKMKRSDEEGGGSHARSTVENHHRKVRTRMKSPQRSSGSHQKRAGSREYVPTHVLLQNFQFPLEVNREENFDRRPILIVLDGADGGPEDGVPLPQPPLLLESIITQKKPKGRTRSSRSRITEHVPFNPTSETTNTSSSTSAHWCMDIMSGSLKPFQRFPFSNKAEREFHHWKQSLQAAIKLISKKKDNEEDDLVSCDSVVSNHGTMTRNIIHVEIID